MGHWRKQTISFFVSTDCNLACRYCYIPKYGDKIAPEDRVIDVEFAVAGMKDFFSWSEKPAIRFFSAGEATTAFNEMAEIRDVAEQLAGKELRSELQTNGYFSDDVADWVERNVDILWISCDGPPELHDAQRPLVSGGGSSDVVLKNVDRFAEAGNIQFGVRVTFEPHSFSRQVEILEFFRDRGVRYICGAPAYSSTVNPDVDVPLLVDFAKHFAPAFVRARAMGVFYQTHLMVNFDEPVKCYCRACSNPVCPQLTSDGYVSCCDWASFGPQYLPGVLQQCVYGKWEKERGRIVYFEDRKSRIENRNVEHLREGPCQGCHLLENCAGGCVGKVIVRSGDLWATDGNWCQAVRLLGEKIPRNEGLYPVRHS